MKRTLLLGAAATAAVTAMAVSAPASAQARNQGGFANPNNLTIIGQQRTMRQNELQNEMRRLRTEARAAKARNGGVLPEAEKVSLQQRLDALKAEYRQAG